MWWLSPRSCKPWLSMKERSVCSGVELTRCRELLRSSGTTVDDDGGIASARQGGGEADVEVEDVEVEN